MTTQHNILEFYKNKYMLASLSGNITPWQNNMLQCITRHNNGDKLALSEDQYGKLRDMYKEDCLLEKVKDLCNPELINPTTELHNQELTFIGSVLKQGYKIVDDPLKITKHFSGQTREYIQYWFSDQDDCACLIELPTTNPFEEIWTNMLTDTITVQGYKKTFTRHKLNFFVYSQWKVLV